MVLLNTDDVAVSLPKAEVAVTSPNTDHFSYTRGVAVVRLRCLQTSSSLLSLWSYSC